MFNLPDGVDLRELVGACLQKRNPALRLGAKINGGGTSVVYHIEGADTPQTLKVMYTDLHGYENSVGMCKRFYEYFTNEVKIMRELSDPHIMPVLDSFAYVVTDMGIQAATEHILKHNKYHAFVFVIMPECQSLTDYHKKHPMTEQNMIQMTVDICQALQKCHNHKILHRDVKPDNIFLPLDGPEHFILGDFGFCRRMEHNIIPRYTAIGTEGFTAPEILRGKTIPKGQYNSDLYALAATIHYLITGNPYHGYYDRKLALKKISPAFCHIIYEKSLPKEPGDRYQDAAEMLKDLRPLHGSGRSVSRNPWFLQAKREMLANHYQQAIQTALDGMENSPDKQGVMDCQRLLAYCQYHENPKNPDVAHTLEMLAAQGDDIARYLRAMMDIRDGSDRKIKSGFQNLRLSAEAGCVLAQYYYGHFLFGNYHELPAGTYSGTNPQQDGLRFLLQAVGTGFPPAAAYLQKVRTQMKLSPELADFLNRQLEDSPHLKDFLAEFPSDRRKFIIDLL
ncbi:MAG: protein kinase [Oscillospiraceae bacterium]|nr:protein kinase [Oscillospiraceae bacterium]